MVEAALQTRVEELALRMEVDSRHEYMEEQLCVKLGRFSLIAILSVLQQISGDVDTMSFPGYRLQRLPELVKDLQTLKECDLSHNRLKEFPHQVLFQP